VRRSSRWSGGREDAHLLLQVRTKAVNRGPELDGIGQDRGQQRRSMLGSIAGLPRGEVPG
jgi:hypothetical protein